MTALEWSEAAERYRAKVAALETSANMALDAGDRNGAYRIFDNAREFEEAAIDAEAKAMQS